MIVLVYKGYEWLCPACGNYNQEAAPTEGVECGHCHKLHQIDGIVPDDKIREAAIADTRKTIHRTGGNPC